MSDKQTAKTDQLQTINYQIRVEGHLSPSLEMAFEGLSITMEGNGETHLTGPIVDQAAQHGLLRKIRDLGMPLISVVRLKTDQTE